MIFNWKFKNHLILSLLSIIILLISILLIKNNTITVEKIASHKDFIDAVNKIIGSILLIIGAVFSYFKFFKGRTFSERLIIDVHVKVFDYNQNQKLHTVDIELHNIGAIPIKNFTCEISANMIDGTENETVEILTEIKPISDNATSIIDTQEIDYKHYKLLVSNDIKAVLYKIKIISSKGDAWTKAFTIINKNDYEFGNK